MPADLVEQSLEAGLERAGEMAVDVIDPPAVDVGLLLADRDNIGIDPGPGTEPLDQVAELFFGRSLAGEDILDRSRRSRKAAVDRGLPQVGLLAEAHVQQVVAHTQSPREVAHGGRLVSAFRKNCEDGCQQILFVQAIGPA